MIRIDNIDKWKQLEPGKFLELPGDRLRRVRIEVNCPQETRLDVIETDEYGEEVAGTFIGNIKGKEVLEFTAFGNLTVMPSNGEEAVEVWYFTQDGDKTAVERDEENFMELMTRQARNPEVERLMYMQQLNFERRMNAMQADTAAQIAAMGTTFNVRTGEPDDGEDSPPAASGAKGAKQPEPAKPEPAKPEGEEPSAPGGDGKPPKSPAK